MTTPFFQPGDRVQTPRGHGTVEHINRHDEPVVQGDEWMFYGTFAPDKVQLVEREVQAA